MLIARGSARWSYALRQAVMIVSHWSGPWPCAGATARDKVPCVVSDPGLRSFARILDLTVHEVSTRAGESAGDLEEVLARLSMVAVLEDRPVTSAVPGGQPEQMLARVGAALAAAPEWPAAGPPGITWPPRVDGLLDSLGALAERIPATAGGFAAGILSVGNCRALLEHAADAVRPLDTAGWTAWQRIVAAAVILAALGVIVPAAGGSPVTNGDLGRALPVIIALAALIGGAPGAGIPGR